jgi:3-isopropylmalate/(R)-2-methylmalate dehydratase small subunit
VQIDFESGQVVRNGVEAFEAEPFSKVQMDIYQAGDLFSYGKALDQG